MTDWKDFAFNLGALSLVGFVVAFGVRGGWKIAQEVMGAENVKEAHTPAPESLQAWGVVNNSGDIQRVSTQRGIINGQAVGQTLNLGNIGPYEKMVNGPDLSSYSMTLSTTYPEFGQNYGGSAVGAN
jgi:hypothetical protein